MTTPAAAPPTRILLAGTQDLHDRLKSVLTGHALIRVEHVDDAVRRFEEGRFGMVIVGVKFDESQMFALLERLRSGRKNPTVPIVCMLTARHGLSKVVVKGLDHAVKALMANAFLNLDIYKDDAQGNGRLRRIIDYLILIDGDMHSGELAPEV